MAGSRGGLFDNLNIPIHRCAAQRRRGAGVKISSHLGGPF